MRWLDRIPLYVLVLIAAWLAVAPISPEPHLVEKARMLSQGVLTQPMDMFDLIFHIAPMGLVALKVWRVMRVRTPRQ